MCVSCHCLLERQERELEMRISMSLAAVLGQYAPPPSAKPVELRKTASR
jgi:hypothetical protein